MNKEEVKSRNANDPGSDIDWENRILCRDGNCIGVIGVNGRCTECGLIFDASQESDDNFEPDDTAPIETDDAASDDNAADDWDELGSIDDEDASVSDSDWEDRKLCSDGNCIGVIGHDGCCRECGKEEDAVDNLSDAA